MLLLGLFMSAQTQVYDEEIAPYTGVDNGSQALPNGLEQVIYGHILSQGNYSTEQTYAG